MWHTPVAMLPSFSASYSTNDRAPVVAICAMKKMKASAAR
jgi:hypothetical protein